MNSFTIVISKKNKINSVLNNCNLWIKHDPLLSSSWKIISLHQNNAKDVAKWLIFCFEIVYFVSASCLIRHLHLVDFTNWIDICQSNGNILVAGGIYKNVRIFDKRGSKIVQTFDDIHNGNIFSSLNKLFLNSSCYFLGQIFCVRWSPSGDLLASASEDKTAALLDFRTGKQLYTGNISDGSKYWRFD